MEKNKLSKNSSLLVSTPALLLWLGLMLLSALAGYMALSGLFLFFLMLFSFVRYWASKAMDGVSLEVSCSRLRLFPAETICSSFRAEIQNAVSSSRKEASAG